MLGACRDFDQASRCTRALVRSRDARAGGSPTNGQTDTETEAEFTSRTKLIWFVWGTPECPVSWCSNIAGLPLVNCFLMTNLKAAPGSDAPSALLGQTRPGCRGCICSVLVVAHRTSQAQCQRSPYSEASLQPSGLELGADSEALAFFAWTLRVRSG